MTGVEAQRRPRPAPGRGYLSWFRLTSAAAGTAPWARNARLIPHPRPEAPWPRPRSWLTELTLGSRLGAADRGLQRHVVAAVALQVGDHLHQPAAVVEVLAADRAQHELVRGQRLHDLGADVRLLIPAAHGAEPVLGLRLALLRGRQLADPPRHRPQQQMREHPPGPRR